MKFPRDDSGIQRERERDRDRDTLRERERERDRERDREIDTHCFPISCYENYTDV